MENYQLTHKAENEIADIYEYSIINFGLAVAQEYVLGIHDCFNLLSENPSWGNNYSFIAPSLYRYEYRSHSIYYQTNEQTTLIIRVLGKKQDPARHIKNNAGNT